MSPNVEVVILPSFLMVVEQHYWEVKDAYDFLSSVGSWVKKIKERGELRIFKDLT